MNEDRMLSGARRTEESRFEESIRPQRLTDYPGQERVKEELSIYIEAAKRRGDALDHVLLYGPPGLGKTTLAQIIAQELGVNFRVTSGPAISHQGDLAAILTQLQERDVLFVDEIHRMNRLVEETLYPAMEDFCLDIILGKGPSARTLRLDLPKFTLIGATTRFGALSSPMRDRFGVVLQLQFYTPDELMQILIRASRILDVELEASGAMEIARRSRGTPRIANRLLRRLRDFAQVKANGKITREVADAGLRLMEVDQLGLDQVDHKILHAIIGMWGGGPVGLDTLAAATAEESETIEDVYEPYLMQIGFLQRTPRGRVATRAAYDYLGMPYQEHPDSQGRLL
ncbi:MAG TPA: Holliday junction branch migration DNA helicase RuvB [Symbiobacteriaceae bacterium]|nr:Holliday junction branch migration DNA helicase RuvB [Symbiobacteriaceae bacterium]